MNATSEKIIALPRTCKTCKKSKSAEFFARVGSIARTCNACFKIAERKRQKAIWKENPEYRERHNAKGKEWRSRNKDTRRLKERPDRLKKNYGITYDEVVQTLNRQFGKCANLGCSKEISLDVPMGADRAVIDHDHETGKFRAILCMKCNFDLGLIEKKQDRILGLIDYLNKYKNKNNKE